MVESCSSNFNINLDNIGLSQDKFALDVGGLIGVVGGDVKNCSSFGQINLNSKENSNPNARILGGLIGTYTDTYPITEMNVINCISSVNILSNFAAYCAGLIGYVETAIKFNVLECSANGNISTTGNGAGGGLLGYFFAEDNSIIADCYSSGNIEIAGFGAGFAEQIKGYYGALKIKNCYSLGNVSGGGRNAGFALEVKAEMKNCYSTGNVISFGISSGFIYCFEGTLEKCYNVGKVVSGNIAVGFIYQISSKSSESLIEKCYAICDVTAERYGSGFIFTLGGATISNSYSKSNVLLTNKDSSVGVAGLVFSTGKGSLRNCYYTGSIIAVGNDRSIIAGLVGKMEGEASNCHWLYHADGNAENSFNYVSSSATFDEIYKYDSINAMFNLSEKLNHNNTESVWVDVEHGTPELK